MARLLPAQVIEACVFCPHYIFSWHDETCSEAMDASREDRNTFDPEAETPKWCPLQEII